MTDIGHDPSAEEVAALSRELEGARAALHLRTVIEQAKGVLAARHAITPDEAFERLRELSQQHNVRLAEVAATLVGVTLRGDFSAPPADYPSSPGLAVTAATSPEWRTFREQAEVRMRTSAAVFRSLSSAAREGSEAARLIHALGAPLGVDAVVIYRLVDDGSLQYVGSEGYPGDLVSAWRGIPPGLDVPLHRAVRDRAPVYLADRAARDREFPGVAHVASTYEASASLPVGDTTHVRGAIGLGWRDPQSFTPELAARVEHLIAAVGPAVLRSAAPADPATLWVSTLLELLFDPWLLLDSVHNRDGAVIDFTIVRAGAAVPGAAGVEQRRLSEVAPGMVGRTVLASLAQVTRFGGPWAATLSGGELGSLSQDTSTVSVRAFPVNQQLVLHWRPGADDAWAAPGAPTRLSPPEATVAGLRDALDRLRADAQRQALIEQAKGALAERRGLALDAAETWLAERAAANGRQVAEVAAEVLGVSPPACLDEATAIGPAVAGHGPDVPHAGERGEDGGQAAALVLELARPLGASGALLYAVVADGSLRLKSARGYPDAVAAAWRAVPLDLDVPLTRAVNDAEPVLLGDGAAQHRAFPDLAGGCMGFAATAALPVVDAGRVIGAIGLAWAREQKFDEDLAQRLGQLVLTAGPPLLRDAQRAEPDNSALTTVLDMLFDPWLLLSPLHDATGRVRDFRVALAGREVPHAAHLTGRRLVETWPVLNGSVVLDELRELAVEGGVRDRVLGPDEVAEPVGDAVTYARGARVGPWVVLVWRTVPR